MTRLVFMGADGVAWVDRVSPYKAQVECPDGNHPISNRSIMRPGNRNGPSIMIVWQGRNAPEGEVENDDIKDATLAETDYTKLHKQKPSVSKLWVRRLLRYMNIAVCGFLVSFGLAVWFILAYAVVLVMTR